MSDKARKEYVSMVVRDVIRGRGDWRQFYLVPLTQQKITFSEIEAEIARIKYEQQGFVSKVLSQLSPMKRFFTLENIVVGSLLTFLAYCYGLGLYRSYQVAHWPKTNGTVLSFSESKSPSGRTYNLVYQYSVAQRKYTSYNVRMGLTEAEDKERYPKNSSVAVFYNPTNPCYAFLDSGCGGAPAFGFVAAVILGGCWRIYRPRVRQFSRKMLGKNT